MSIEAYMYILWGLFMGIENVEHCVYFWLLKTPFSETEVHWDHSYTFHYNPNILPFVPSKLQFAHDCLPTENIMQNCAANTA